MEQLSTNVWWIRLAALPGWTVNAYLVDDDGVVTLVDTGLPWNRRGLKKSITAAGYRLADIDRVLITHYDLDHFGGLLSLRPELDATVYASSITSSLFAKQRKPGVLHHKGAVHRALMRVVPRIEAVPIDDEETVGGFTAYHCPGHNPGHTAYLHEPSGTCFFGDLVRTADNEFYPPVAWDNYSIPGVAQGIHDIADRIPRFETACPGHGAPVLEGAYESFQSFARSTTRVQQFTYISVV